LGESVFFDLKNRGTKVDEEAVLFAGSAKIPQELGDMFVEDRFHGFQLYNQFADDKQIKIEIPE
jgi:hypothetical protein